MSPSNRTAERLRSLEKALAAGKLTAEAFAKKKAKLEALGESWEARWTLADGKTERTKTFKGKGAEKKAADYEQEQKILVRRGEAQDPLQARSTIAKVLDFYLEHKMHRDGKPRESFKNARAHRNNIVEAWGERFTFEALDRDPEPHMKALKRALERKVPGGAWNNKVTLRAAIAYWIRRKRLRMTNPVDVIDWPKPKNTRKERISWEMHRKLVQTAKGLEFPAWVHVYLEMGWETAWRAGEIQDWQVERMHLNPTGEDFPWVQTLVEKQGEGEPVYEDKPISFRAAGLIRSLLGNRTQGPVWPLKRTMHDRYVRRVFNAAGFPKFQFHDYRRSMKKRMEDAGVSKARGAAYTGHSEEMHDRYNVMPRKDLEEVLRQLEPGHIRDIDRENG